LLVQVGKTTRKLLVGDSPVNCGAGKLPGGRKGGQAPIRGRHCSQPQAVIQHTEAETLCRPDQRRASDVPLF